MVDIRITDQDIAAWKAEKEELEAKLAEVKRRLEAVKLLTEGQIGDQTLDLPERVSTETGFDKSEVLLALIEERDRYMSPREMRELLRERGETEETWREGFLYVYQVLKRLADKGRVCGGKIKGTNDRKYKITDEGRAMLPASHIVTPEKHGR